MVRWMTDSTLRVAAVERVSSDRFMLDGTEPLEHEGPANGSRAVGRVVAILNELSQGGGPLRLTAISRRLQIPLSSTRLLLKELCREEVVSETVEGQYEVGPGLVLLSARIMDGVDLVAVVRRHMEALAARIDQDVYLALARQDGIAYVQRVHQSRGIRVHIPLGVVRSLHASAVGQLYLAWQLPERQRALLEACDFAPRTARTITSRSRLETKLAEIKDAGFCRTDEECVDGIIGLCAPLLNSTGQLDGALGLSVFKAAYAASGVDLVMELLRSCRAASRDMGWLGSTDQGRHSSKEGRRGAFDSDGDDHMT